MPRTNNSIAQEFITAYNVLASRRTAGFAVNPISLAEIYAFIGLFGAPSVSIETFVELIGVMDVKYLELSNGNRTSSNR